MQSQTTILKKCQEILKAYREGRLGNCVMPEDTNPGFDETQKEERLSYFTLPMSLNYQRNSYKLWEAALNTYKDSETKDVFDLKKVAGFSPDFLRAKLVKHKLALQPTKHITTWLTIAQTISKNWGTFEQMLEVSGKDFLILKETIQKNFKKGFPYLSGTKIFNYWSFIISKYGQVELKNRHFIEVAPDTHVIKGSIVLGIISEDESSKISREEICQRWRSLLEGSGIDPIDMHSPLWFWSRNNFEIKLA